MQSDNITEPTNNEPGEKCHIPITIAGTPNAGKSTFLNYIVQEKVSITSPSAQTTHTPIRASLNQNNTQLLFMDSPGAFRARKGFELEKTISKIAWHCLRDTPHTLLLFIDGKKGIDTTTKDIIQDLQKRKVTGTAVINKIDAISDKKKLEIAFQLEPLDCINNIFYISSTKGYGTKKLLDFLFAQPAFPEYAMNEETLSDSSLEFTISEALREQIFLNFKQEVPYEVHVETTSCNRDIDNDIHAEIDILVSKDIYKGMIIGAKGLTLKKIREKAESELTKIYLATPNLTITVRLDPKWKERRITSLS